MQYMKEGPYGAAASSGDSALASMLAEDPHSWQAGGLSAFLPQTHHRVLAGAKVDPRPVLSTHVARDKAPRPQRTRGSAEVGRQQP